MHALRSLPPFSPLGAPSPPARLLFMLLVPALLAGGCGDEGEGDGKDGQQSAPCRGRCGADEVCVLDAAGEEECVKRECGLPDLPCSDPAQECVGYRCLGKRCTGDGECGEGWFCSPETGRCAQGCTTGTCPDGQYCHPVRHVCLAGCEEDGCPEDAVCELSLRTCRTCECRADDGCAAGYYCATLERDGDCRCYRGCRTGEGNDSCITEGERCDPELRRCREWSCARHEQCYEHEYCNPDEYDIGRCREGCRDDGSCAEEQICYNHGCLQAVLCLDDLECKELLPGTRCDRSLDPPLCRPYLCPVGDADCPQEPQLFRCNELQQCEEKLFFCNANHECELGQCRSDADCLDPQQRCGQGHLCVRRTCARNTDCSEAEYCDLRGAEGVCRAGCWKQEQCPADQPCRIEEHACGCFADRDCAAYEAPGQPFICEQQRCSEACLGHEDCGPGRYCEVDGHCRTGCRPDRFEPNESRDQAVLLQLQENEQTQTARLLLPGLMLCGAEGGTDNDWYAVQLGAGDELQVEASWSDCAAGQLVLSLWRANREGQEEGRPDGDGRCRLRYQARPAPMAGLVFLQLEGLDAVDLEYELEVNAVRAFRCRPDGQEPNQGRDQARAVGARCLEGLSICENDEDWFAIPLQLRDQLQVTVDYEDARGDLQAEVYPPRAGAPWLVRAVGEMGRITLNLDANRTVLEGSYLLRVRARPVGLEAVETTYAFCWERTPFVPPCDADGFEQNDVREQARNLFGGRLGPGVHAAEGLEQLSLCSGDEDWYLVEVAAPSTIHITAHNDLGPEEDQLIELELYRGEERIAVSASAGPDNRIDADLPAPGVYHLRVVHPLFHEEDETFYRMTVSLSVGPTGDCVADRLEPNDRIAQAVPMVVLPNRVTTLSNLTLCTLAQPGRSPDLDWFRIDLRGLDPSFLRLGLRFAHAQGDLDLSLRDEADHNPCQQPAQCHSQSEDDDELIQLEGLQPMLYLAKVYCALGECRNSYDLELEVGLRQCQDDGHEPNDTLATARALDVQRDRPYALHLCPGDEDWFAIRAPGGRDVQVRLDHHFFDGDLDLQLLDQDGMVLVVSDRVNDDRECAVVQSPPAGTLLYVYVYGVEPGVSNDYQLSFSTGQGLVCEQ